MVLDVRDPEHPKSVKTEPFLRTPADERDPAVSLDGAWIAYCPMSPGDLGYT
jgi:hypothetical protein